jgi:hypothetical protein
MPTCLSRQRQIATLKRRKKCAADEKAFRMGRGEDVVMIMRRIWSLFGFSSSLF